jgi:hypothetical protein
MENQPVYSLPWTMEITWEYGETFRALATARNTPLPLPVAGLFGMQEC